MDKIKVFWETARAVTYQIAVSDDSLTGSWTIIYNGTNASPNNQQINSSTFLDDIALSGAAGRYVRVLGQTSTTAWGYSIWEFEVYGTPFTNP